MNNNNNNNLKKKFCFQFNCEGTHKTLDEELIILLFPLALGGGGEGTTTTHCNNMPKECIDSFCKFLTTSSSEEDNTTNAMNKIMNAMNNDNKTNSHDCIALDQWTSLCDFCLEYSDQKDIKDCNEDASAWPVLIDECVDWCNSKKN